MTSYEENVHWMQPMQLGKGRLALGTSTVAVANDDLYHIIIRLACVKGCCSAYNNSRILPKII